MSLDELIQLYKTQISSASTGGVQIATNHVKILELLAEAVSTPVRNSTDYIYDIIGETDGVNKVFKVRGKFTQGTTAVWLDGMRMTPTPDEGYENYDYRELEDDRIRFSIPPEVNSNIIITYHDPNKG